MGDPSADRTAVARAWAEVGAEQQKGERALQRVLKNPNRELSLRERQLVALARAWVRKPTLLVLDEASAQLDAASDALICAALVKQVDASSTLIIAHRLTSIQNADRLLILSNGQICETGSRDQLLRSNGSYAAMERAWQSSAGGT